MQREPVGDRPRLELLEDDVLAAPVELQRHVPALAPPLVDGALGDAVVAANSSAWRAAIRRQMSSQSTSGSTAAMLLAPIVTVVRMGADQASDAASSGRSRSATGRSCVLGEAGRGTDRADRPPLRRCWRPRGSRSSGSPCSPRAPPTAPTCASGSPSCSPARSRSSGSRPGPASPSGCCATTRSRPGVDPFFEPAGPADRLALLLDRLDELPLRRHEIRGNPAGLLARLLERIDALKAEGIGPAELRDRARAPERGAAGRADREVALREVEFGELYDRHDAIMLELGVLDEGELVLELGRLLTRHPDLSDVLGERFECALVDELEDAGGPRVGLLPLLAPHGRVLRRLRSRAGAAGPARLRRGGRVPISAASSRRRETVELGPSRRSRRPLARSLETARSLVPGHSSVDARRRRADDDRQGGDVRFWRCANERAEAQAVAREIEQLLAAERVRAVGHLRPRRRHRPREPADRRGAGGAKRPLPRRRRGRVLRPARGPRHDRLAAGAGRPGRLGRGRPGADPAADRAPLGRPRSLHDHRQAPQARHGLGARGGAREPAAAAALPRSAALVPEALPGRGLRVRRPSRRRLRPPPDRADRLSPPRPLRREPGDGGASRQPLPARRARRRLDPAAAGRLDP